MSEAERRAQSQPLLAFPEGLVQDVRAHLRRFRAFWLAVLVVALAAAVGLHTGLDRLASRWVYPYDHSWLVLGMSAWLLAKALRRTTPARIGPSLAGFGALVAVVLFYALAEVLDISLGMQVALPLVLFALVTALGGLQLARISAVPLAMLYFTIPIWDLTIPVLQKISLAVVAFLVSVTGPVAYTTGTLITIPAGSFEIAEGCSGMRYFMVSLAIAAFIGLAWYQRWGTRLLLLAVAGLAAMVSNWIRIYTLILIGDASNMQHYFIAKSHDGYGWMVYVVFLLPVLWFARVLEQREARDTPEERSATAVVAPAGLFLAAALLASAVVASPALLRRGGAGIPAPPHVVLLADAAGWEHASRSITWRPRFEAPYFETQEAMLSPRQVPVDVYVARYLRQRPRSKLISSHNELSPEWQVIGTDEQSVPIGGGTRSVRETRIAFADERRLVWEWFLVGGHATHSRPRAKLLEVRGLMRGRRDGAVIALSAPCLGGCDQARAAMTELLESAGARLEAVANGQVDGLAGGAAHDANGSGVGENR